MFNWKKLGKVFDPTILKSYNWMQEYAQAPSVVIFDDYIRIYFSSRGLPDPHGLYVSQLGYIDVDRKNLFDVIGISPEPVLPLGELGTFDQFGIYPASVIRTDEDFRIYYAGWTRCESVPFNAAIGVAVSNDNGNSFSRIGNGPVLSYTPFEPFVLGSPKIRKFNGVWYIWYSAGIEWARNGLQKAEPIYKIRMAHSADGINWVKHGENIIGNVLEDSECQASADVFYCNNKYHMFFSYRYHLNFRDPGRGYRIGYAYSEDLVNWTRDDAKAGIEKSSEGWDSESVSYPHLFQVDGKIYMLYQGNEIGRYGFGLAELADETLK